MEPLGTRAGVDAYFAPRLAEYADVDETADFQRMSLPQLERVVEKERLIGGQRLSLHALRHADGAEAGLRGLAALSPATLETVTGHSFGTMSGLSMALQHASEALGGGNKLYETVFDIMRRAIR